MTKRTISMMKKENSKFGFKIKLKDAFQFKKKEKRKPEREDDIFFDATH